MLTTKKTRCTQKLCLTGIVMKLRILVAPAHERNAFLTTGWLPEAETDGTS